MTRVLIVDDDHQVLRLISRILHHEYTCITANSVAEARHHLEASEFELALIDVNMPGESGLDLLAYIRRVHPDVAALMVTGIDDRQLADAILENGAYGYIVKPFKPNEFQIHVANILRRHRLELESKSYQQRLEETVEFRTLELRGAIKRLEEAEQEVRSSREETVHRLAKAVEFRSAETGRHIERMSLYSGLLARRLGLEPDRCELIQIASAMHDIGKIGTPDHILHKPGKLTREEFEIIKEHCEVGYRIFADSSAELLSLAATIAWTHHERWDGNGYPRGLIGLDIPLEARIASIGDVFDALTSKRVYKDAFGITEVIEIMSAEGGRQFDPELIQLFVASLDDVLAIREKYGDSSDGSLLPAGAGSTGNERRKEVVTSS